MTAEPISDDLRTEESFTIHQSRWRMVGFALIALLCAVFMAGFAVVTIAEAYSPGFDIFFGVGILCIILSLFGVGYFFIYSFRIFQGKREIVVISNEGLQVPSGVWLRWDDIESIRKIQYWGTPMLLIEPADIESYLVQQHLLTRVFKRLTPSIVRAPINISESEIPISIAELRVHIRRYQNQDSDQYEQVPERAPITHSSDRNETADTTDESLPPFTTGTVEAIERMRNSSHTRHKFDVHLASGHKTTFYITTSETITEPPVTRLLEARGLTSVHDLVGQEITLERSGEFNGHYTLSVPTDAWFISRWWIYGVIACLIGQIPLLIHPTQLWRDVFLIAYILAPIVMYFEARYVRAESEWDPSSSQWGEGTHWPESLYWPGLMLIPWINVLLGVVYLYKRWQAAFRP